MKFITTMVLICGSFFLSQCVFLKSISNTNIPADRSQPVSSQVSNGIFFGFNFDNDHVDLLSEKLRFYCKGGRIEGILTKNEDICYLPFCIYYRNQVTATGYCQK